MYIYIHGVKKQLGDYHDLCYGNTAGQGIGVMTTGMANIQEKLVDTVSLTAEDQTEMQWVHKAKQGDKQAFGYLVKAYMQKAYFIALSIVHNHEKAVDLSQEAFVKAYYAFNTFDESRRFFPWYYRILKNACLGELRKSKRSVSFSELGENQPEISNNEVSQHELMEADERKEQVWAAINKLKANEREILLLREIQGLSYEDIAQMLGCPQGTVMSRLYTARQALKNRLQKMGVV